MSKTEDIDEQWSRLMRDSDPHVRRIAEIASQYPSLRRLYPFASLRNLRFSRCTTYPYDLDLPYVLTTPDGAYEARGGNHEPLSRGEIHDVVARVAAAVKESQDP